MSDLYNGPTLESLLDGLTDLNKIPKEYSLLLEPYFQSIAKHTHLKSKGLKLCRFNFRKWDAQDGTVDPEAIRRCLDLWYVLKGKEYKKLKNPPSVYNIIKDEVDVSHMENLKVTRLEFDEFGKPITNPLHNLILEEVEVNDFITE
ncbi:YNR004W [Saccharomyces arboricola H-6]|uniref:Nucleolar protein SWM2 n=1 Tax=Saccharomyces arboricola (strain H-6 / AS 2.3317 / CBS 10644) TaxID=1160507 RepID=J8PWZ7_SACAR|nr:YNR004W [Saccharomyces arboricola H-6]